MTPSGMPASTKPMKSGTAEQEQNGVTMPNEAAAAEPATLPRPASAARTFSGGKKPRIRVTTVMIPSRSSSTLGTSSRKKRDRLAEVAAALEAEDRKREPVRERRLGEPGDEPGDDRNGDRQLEREMEASSDGAEAEGGHRMGSRTVMSCASAAVQAASSRS